MEVYAEVSNAKDGTVNWSADSCATISGSGNTIRVNAFSCGSNVTVTGRLNNGASSSVSFAHEDNLSVSLTKYGSPVELDATGTYYGNDLTITSNVPAYITGSGLLGDSSSLRTSAKTNGAATTTVTISTPCGQTKSVKITAIIN